MDEMLKELWDQAPTAMGIYDYTATGLKVVALNDQYFNMVGDTRESRAGYRAEATDAIHPDDHAALLGAIKNAIQTGGVANARIRVMGGDGTYGWYGVRGSWKPWENGCRFFAVFYDITELMDAEAHLADQMRQLRNAKDVYEFSIAGTELFLWEYDLVKDEITLGDNPFTLKRKKEIGYPDVVPNASRFIYANVMPESKDTMKRIFDDIQAGKEYTSGDIHFRAGGDEGYTICRVSYCTICDENGKPVKAYGCEQNITDTVLLRDNYAKELARFESDVDKTIIFRLHASLTQNITMESRTGKIVLPQGGTYDENMARLFTGDTFTRERDNLREVLERGRLIKAYNDGERHFTCEYRWPGQVAWKWIKAEINLVLNPATSDVEMFLYTMEDTADRIRELVLDRMSATVYDYIAVVVVADGSYMLQTAEGVVDTNSRLTYNERAYDLVNRRVVEDDRKTADDALTFDHVIDELNAHNVYVVNTAEQEEDGTIAYKMRQYTWLDDQKELFLICVSDISETMERRQQMEERIENDTAILRQASLDAYDFISLIDVASETITLRSGSWFNRDVPTPEHMRTIPYNGLLDFIGKNYALSEEEGKAFFKRFSISSISEELKTKREIYFPFDFLDATDKQTIKYKQFRFSWLDEAHTKILAVRSDVTETMRKEKQLNMQMKDALESAEAANNAKSEFLSRMSHDIRTPMNAIIGFSTLLLKNADNPDKVADQSRKILYSSNHLLGLINDVLDMSKIETGKLHMNVHAFKLSETIRMVSEIMRPQMEERHQTFDIYVSGVRHEMFVADSQRLQQILINILSNATKYTQEGGHVSLRVKGLPERSGKYETICFEVEDNGRGMSEEYQKIIFEPFSREQLAHQESAQGTGLGMAITKNLVNIMGGTISVKSKLDEGSTFTIVLPMHLSNEEEDLAFWENHDITHMLVVDDEEEVCLNVTDAMKNTGVRMDYALDGATSVKMLEDAHNAFDDYHIVLLDWKMPGMDGVDTARAIRRKLPPDVLIIILTAYDYSEIEAEARAAGVDGFMTKPFFMQGLERVVRETKNYTDEEDVTPHETHHEEEDAGANLSGLNVLAAEDNELNAEILIDLMDLHDITVTVEENGQDVLHHFRNAAPHTYDLILMDIQMPVMNGYDATRAIRALADDESLSDEKRAEARDIPIIAMTANAFSDDVQNALEAGMNAHVAKPLDIDVLKKTLNKILG